MNYLSLPKSKFATKPPDALGLALADVCSQPELY